MPSRLTTFKRRVRAADRTKLLQTASDMNDDGLWTDELKFWFIRAAYEWDLDDSTGIGKRRTDDELRAMLIKEYAAILKRCGDVYFDVDDDEEPPTQTPRRRTRSRRTPEPEPNLFADPCVGE